MAELNPNIILQGRSPDILGAMQQGNALAQQTNEMRQQQKKNAFLRENGQGVLSGDQNVLAQLAQYDLPTAVNIQTTNRNNARADEQLALQHERYSVQDARNAQQDALNAEKWQVTLNEKLSKMNANDLAAERDKFRVGYQAAAGAKTPQEWDEIATRFEVPQLIGQFDRKDEILRSLLPMGDYLDQYQPGAPEYETRVIKMADGSEVMVERPEGTNEAWQPSKIPEGGTTGMGSPAKLTESQARMTLFKSMQDETQPVLNQMEEVYDPSNMRDAAARNTPLAGNFYKTQEGQQYQSAASAWAEGALRLATGAAATPEEFERTINTYFAQPGDMPETIQFKARMRDMYSRSIQRALGQSPEGALSLPTPAEFAERIEGTAGQQNGEQGTASGNAVQTITDDAEFDALPSGALFKGPDGVTRRKP